MDRFRLLALAAAGLLAAACAASHKHIWRSGAGGEAYELLVLVDGAVLPVHEHAGQSWIEGRSPERYALRVHNRSPERVEAVVAVDGLDVIDGRPFDPERRGYVIEPGGWVDIDGWRTSLEGVAAFRFTSPEDSYAMRTGASAREIGRIEVALFRERALPRPPLAAPGGPPAGGWDTARPSSVWGAEAERAERDQRKLGTRFGERRYSPVAECSFERASSSPAARLGLRYDSAEGLCDAGLQAFCFPPRGPIQPRQPEPAAERRYAEPPPGWEHFEPSY